MKQLDFNKTVYELVKEYPEVKDIMVELGFTDIAKPAALNTVGRIMTIPKGASIKDIPMEEILNAFQSHGFEIAGCETEVKTETETESKTNAVTAETPEDRQKLLQSYVARLSNGESLESVRSEFVKNFKDVDAGEIALAEQTLIQNGAKISDVQRLCDVHSALFHGATRQEQIAKAESAVMASLNERSVKALEEGHPVSVFMKENEEIQKRIDAVRNGEENAVHALRTVTVHYAAKGDLLYPLLNRKYGYSGPSDVMWGVDDEIRDELKVLDESSSLPDYQMRLEKVTDRAEEMIYKENNILYPLCLQQFSEDEWMQIYYEMVNYPSDLRSSVPVWKEAEERREALKIVGGRTSESTDIDSGKNNASDISLGSGHMNPEQIAAVLNTIPMELSFVDENNINRYFNAGEKLFKRPDMAIDRDVFSCHPPKVEMMVREIISSFREGKRDSVDVWMNKGGEPVLVRYMAVRNEKKEYLGTLECVQKMTFAKEHFEGGKTDA